MKRFAASCCMLNVILLSFVFIVKHTYAIILHVCILYCTVKDWFAVRV